MTERRGITLIELLIGIAVFAGQITFVRPTVRAEHDSKWQRPALRQGQSGRTQSARISAQVSEFQSNFGHALGDDGARTRVLAPIPE
jgi:prepilin-type N-terminal cleavage/methylation domain-containing protein